MSYAFTAGSGTTMYADVMGTPTSPSAGDQLAIFKVAYGALGAHTPVTSSAPLPVQHSNGTQNMPTGDAVGRRIYVQHTDGTNSTPSMDAVGRAGFVKLTDGTNTAVTFDAAARRGYVQLNDGTSDVKTASATNLAALVSTNALLVATPGQWSATHAPAVNTQATISKAAGGASVRHVCTAVSFALTQSATGGTPYTGQVNLRDGASGAGTILASWTIAVPTAACSNSNFSLTGLNIVGSANTAMTLEFTAAGGAQTLESVAIQGYSV